MSDMSDDGSVEFLGTAPAPPPHPPPIAKGDKKVRAKPKLKTSGAGKAPAKPSQGGKEGKGKLPAKDSKKVTSGNGSSKKSATSAAATTTVPSKPSAKSKTSAKAKAAPPNDKDTPSKKQEKKKAVAAVVVKEKPKKKKKPVSPPQKRPSGMMSILDLCNNNADDDDETEDDEPLRRTPSPQHPHRPLVMPSYSGPHVGGLFNDGVSSVDEEDDSASVVDSENGSIKTPPKKRAKKSTAKAPRPQPAAAIDGVDDEDDDDDEDGAEEGWSDHNRWYCNICKDGGELLCCDRCPRAFHMACLGMKDKAIPDTEWFCKMCAECLDRRRIKKETREKARLMREAAKLERDATKRKMQQMKEDIIAQKNSEAIEHKAKRVLEMQDRILSRKKIKYKDKEEETLGKLAEDLAQTVRAAKERLEKLEKEDAALKKKEEAFNKKKKVGVDEAVPEDDAASATTKPDKPTPLPCSFGNVAADHIGDLLTVWDCLTSFASIIEVAPVTLDQLAAGLAHQEPSALITEVHMCLLHLILEDREEEDYVSDDEASMDEAERFRFEIQHAPVTIGVPTSTVLNSTSWPSVLYNLIMSVPRYAASITPALRDALQALNQKEYPSLELSQKLILLKFLISRAYATESFRQLLGKHVSESVNASKEFSRAALLDRKTAAEEEKKMREKQRLELGELVEQGKGSVKTWLKKGGSNGAADTASVEGEEEEKKAIDTNGASNGGGTAPSSDSELDDLSEEALVKNEEDLEQLLTNGFISRHEYLSRKKQLELQRDKLRRRAEEQLKKQKLLEQQERKRTAAKKSIQEALVAKDPTLLKVAIEKAAECDLPERIIVSATHVLEILDAEAAREEEAEARKKKFNKTMRELFLRTEPLGRDKNGLRYWIFRGDKQHLYIEQPRNFDLKRHFEGGTSGGGYGEKEYETGHASWSCYSSQAEVKALMASLDERHVAEAQLRSALKENMDALADEMPMAKPGLLLADLSNDNDAKKRAAKGRAANGTAHSDGGPVDFLAWRNTKKSWKKKRHLESDMDAFREELLEVDAWLTKRLRELGSGWSDSSHSEWVTSVKGMTTIEDAANQLLAVEHEVMEFQRRIQSLVPVNEQSDRNGKSSNGESSAAAASAKDPEKSDEEDDDDDDELEEVEAAEDESSVLWPTKKSRDRWVTEVKHAQTMATLSAAFGSFVLRLDAFGLSEFAADDTVATRRAKTEKEKQSRKERAVKKKQQQQQEAEEADVDTDADADAGSRRHSIDDWEEDCYICTEGGELLCCDGCPRVFHYPCVGLRRVPRGKTFCHYCDPTVKPVYPVVTGRKRTRAKVEPDVVAESVDDGSTADGGSEDESDAEVAVETGSLNAATKTEDQWDVECGVCRLGGELLCCDGCPRAFHTKCIDLKTVPEDEWFCDECNLQTCGLCKKNKIRLDAHVICGSEDGTKGCEKVFHLKCAKLSSVPEDDWYCKKCQKTLSK